MKIISGFAFVEIAAVKAHFVPENQQLLKLSTIGRRNP